MIHSSILAGKPLKRACFCVILVFMLMIQTFPFLVKAQTTTISIDPVSSVVSLNQTFQVNVTVANVVDCTSWQFGVYYRNDILNCSGITEGSFLSSGGSTFFYMSQLNNTYNSTTGFALAVCQLMPRVEGVPVNGSGVMARVTFTAIGTGNTTLHLDQTILGDEKVPIAQPISHSDADGSVQVTGPGTTTIECDPTSYSVSLNQTFHVNVALTNVVNLTSWQFGIYYRNDVLSCTGVSEGSFLVSGGPTFFYVSQLNNAYNSTTGFVLAVCQLSPRSEGVPVNGSGLLAQVTFQAIGASDTVLHFTQTVLGDEKVPQAQPIPHADQDGVVQVIGPQPDVHVSPATLTGAPGWININDPFTINITISTAAAFDLNLNYWHVGLSFNPSVLECVNFTEGSFLSSFGSTVWQAGTVDNNAGLITAFADHLGTGVGANGNGTLAYVTFRVKDTGSSSLFLQNCFLLDINGLQIPMTVHSGLFELLPVIPKPPTAFFTLSPISPYVNDTITFDATGSTANNVNGTIVSYSWDFGDSSQGQGKVLKHVYTSAGMYNVTLTVVDDRNMTGLFSELVTVIPIPVGASIDVYTEKGGKGLNVPSDTFGPEEEVIMYAYVTYDLVPVPGKVVTFYVNNPDGTVMTSAAVQTDGFGIAFTYFLTLAVPVFGKYNVNATVTVGTKTVSDVCQFNINWLVQVISAVPCDVHGIPQTIFDIGEPFYLRVTIQNNRLSPTYALVSSAVYDNVSQVVLYSNQMYYAQPNQTIVLMSLGPFSNTFPRTYPGPGACAHTYAVDMGGRRASPEFDSVFDIHPPSPNVAIIGVSASLSDTYVGHAVKITVKMLNRYLATQDCNVEIRLNNTRIATLNIVALPPWQETTYVFVWFTDTYGQSYYTLSAVALPVPGEVDLSDNTYTDGTIHLGPPIGMFDDISVTNVSSEKSIVGIGFPTLINITLHNEGSYSETSNLTVYANQIPIPNTSLQMISLQSGQQKYVTFIWNTTGFNYGNYTLTAVLDSVPNETDLDDNVGYSQNVRIGVPGDVSGTTPGVPDGTTNMKDVAYLVSLFMTTPNSQKWNCNADINGDGVCNMKDIAIAVYYFNQHT